MESEIILLLQVFFYQSCVRTEVVNEKPLNVWVFIKKQITKPIISINISAYRQ